jgi:hypothetical protein
MKKIREEDVSKLRTKIASIILSCETLEQLQSCETWFYRLRLKHPNREFLQGHFNNMFTYMYLNQRKKFINREDNLLQ